MSLSALVGTAVNRTGIVGAVAHMAMTTMTRNGGILTESPAHSPTHESTSRCAPTSKNQFHVPRCQKSKSTRPFIADRRP